MSNEEGPVNNSPDHQFDAPLTEEALLRCASRKIAQSLASVVMSSNDLLKSKSSLLSMKFASDLTSSEWILATC